MVIKLKVVEAWRHLNDSVEVKVFDTGIKVKGLQIME